MINNSFLCIIKDGLYRHPIYLCRDTGLEPKLLEYCPIKELGEVLSRYANTYNINDVILDGHPSFMAVIRDTIYHENIMKYGEKKLNIIIARKDLE